MGPGPVHGVDPNSLGSEMSVLKAKPKMHGQDDVHGRADERDDHALVAGVAEP